MRGSCQGDRPSAVMRSNQAPHCCCDCRDTACLSESSTPAQVDCCDVYAPGEQQWRESLDLRDGLTGCNEDVECRRRASHLDEPSDDVAAYGILYPVRLELGQRMQDVTRCWNRPARVHLYHDVDIGTDRGADLREGFEGLSKLG